MKHTAAHAKAAFAVLELAQESEGNGMDAARRPPRPSEHALEQPDSTGEWFFSGDAYVGYTDYTKSIIKMDVRRFAVIEKDGEFYPADSDNLRPFLGVKWVGWWVKIGDP